MVFCLLECRIISCSWRMIIIPHGGKSWILTSEGNRKIYYFSQSIDYTFIESDYFFIQFSNSPNVFLALSICVTGILGILIGRKSITRLDSLLAGSFPFEFLLPYATIVESFTWLDPLLAGAFSFIFFLSPATTYWIWMRREKLD